MPLRTLKFIFYFFSMCVKNVKYLHWIRNQMRRKMFNSGKDSFVVISVGMQR